MGDEANVDDGRLDVAVVRAIGDVLVAAIYNGMVVTPSPNPGEGIGEAIGKGYAAFLKASKAQDGPAKDGDELACILATRAFRGATDWSWGGKAVSSRVAGLTLSLDEARRIVDGRDAGDAKPQKAVGSVISSAAVLNQYACCGVEDWKFRIYQGNESVYSDEGRLRFGREKAAKIANRLIARHAAKGGA
jgi:hypothetical protein